MSEPLEVQFARLEERLKTIFETMERERSSRSDVHKELQAISHGMATLSHRVGNVESSLANSAPTIEEFITIKHKMVGAGLLGKWVWGIAGGLITFLFTMRKEFMSWFGN